MRNNVQIRQLESIASRSKEEIVAVGFSCVAANGGELLWYQLTNTLSIPASGDQFHVDGMELHSLIQEVHSAHPHAQLEVLWHSHYVSEYPSQIDVEFFPEDMFDVGMVYHAPSGRTTPYNKQGAIQSA